MTRTQTTIVAALLVAWAAVAAVRYVDPDATGANNGSSWANAHTTLNAAIAAGAAEIDRYSSGELTIVLVFQGGRARLGTQAPLESLDLTSLPGRLRRNQISYQLTYWKPRQHYRPCLR